MEGILQTTTNGYTDVRLSFFGSGFTRYSSHCNRVTNRTNSCIMFSITLLYTSIACLVETSIASFLLPFPRFFVIISPFRLLSFLKGVKKI